MNDLTALEKQTIERAVAGDQKALEEVLAGVQDLVFNLSLRMLGLLPDAEDATQEILIKVMTRLSSFRQESSLSTWVFRIALNHLRDYKKGMFAQRPLSFEIYGEDIASGRERDVPDLGGGVDQGLLERELKLSCTNVMLQCLDAESRCIYVLGTMFRLDSRVAADILGLNPAAYRQRLSRIRKKVGAFLGEYCGLGGGGCSCKRRTNYAIATHIGDGEGEFPRPGAPCLFAHENTSFFCLSACRRGEVHLLGRGESFCLSYHFKLLFSRRWGGGEEESNFSRWTGGQAHDTIVKICV